MDKNTTTSENVLAQSSLGLSPKGSAVSFGDPRLLQPPSLISEITDHVRRDAEVLLREIKISQGIVLAAPVIGISRRLLAFMVDGRPLILVNPKIVHASNVELVLHEKCVCSPQLTKAAWRPTRIEVHFYTMTGENHTLSAQGPSAQLLAQHIEYLTGPMPHEKMTKYEALLSSLSQFNFPIPRIAVNLFNASEKLRAMPGDVAFLLGGEGCEYKAVWQDERIIDLIACSNGDQRTLASLDTRCPLGIKSEIDKRLLHFLSLLPPESRILMYGLDDPLLHLKILGVFTNFKFQVTGEDFRKLQAVRMLTGMSESDAALIDFEDAIRGAKKDKFDLIFSSSDRIFLDTKKITDAEAKLRMLSKSLSGKGFLMLRCDRGVWPDEDLQDHMLSIFPSVYNLEAHNAKILVGSRSALELAQWQGLAYNALRKPWSCLDFSPVFCNIEAISKYP